MICTLSPLGPVGAAVLDICQAAMKTILHIGAHRTGTTTFQHYMRNNRARFSELGIGFWGPGRTRKGLLAGVLHPASHPGAARAMKRAQGRVRVQRRQAVLRGVEHLIVSDENMLGAMRANLSAAALYPAARDRLARFFAVFDGRIDAIWLSIRSPELHWASVAAHLMDRGWPVPHPQTWAEVAQSQRTWRDVITDVAGAAPDVPIRVFPFERFAGQPDEMVRSGLDRDVPCDSASRWLNRSRPAGELQADAKDRGDQNADVVPRHQGRWMPFDASAQAELKERYADDVMWLQAGASGVAQLEDRPVRHETGQTPQNALTDDANRGHPNDGIKERYVARPG